MFSAVWKDVYDYRTLQLRRFLLQERLEPSEEQRLDFLEQLLAVPGEEKEEPSGEAERRERRRFRRVRAGGTCNVQLGGSWYQTGLVDVGGGGFAAGSVDSVRTGDVIKLRVRESDVCYEFGGQVAWADDSFMGVCFVGVPAVVDAEAITPREPEPEPEPARPRRRASSSVGSYSKSRRRNELSDSRLRLRRPFATPPPEMKRRAPRYPVRLAVRYSSAGEFVREYAENLSSGGMFVGGAHRLPIGTTVDVTIDLPGYERFAVLAEVRHVKVPETSGERQRPGAGLAITEAPPEFEAALRDYLARVGVRQQSCVLVREKEWLGRFRAAGFLAFDMPEPQFAREAVHRAGDGVVGVVLPRATIADYRRALGRTAGPLLPLDYGEEFDDVLAALDANAAKRLR